MSLPFSGWWCDLEDSDVLRTRSKNELFESYPIPIPSMYGNLRTWMMDFVGRCREIYRSSHGWYGYRKVRWAYRLVYLPLGVGSRFWGLDPGFGGWIQVLGVGSRFSWCMKMLSNGPGPWEWCFFFWRGCWDGGNVAVWSMDRLSETRGRHDGKCEVSFGSTLYTPPSIPVTTNRQIFQHQHISAWSMILAMILASFGISTQNLRHMKRHPWKMPPPWVAQLGFWPSNISNLSLGKTTGTKCPWR